MSDLLAHFLTRGALESASTRRFVVQIPLASSPSVRPAGSIRPRCTEDGGLRMDRPHRVRQERRQLTAIDV